MDIERLVSSPCCIAGMDHIDILRAYAELGFRKFEVFTSDDPTSAAFNYCKDPEVYLEIGEQYGMAFHSVHLPRIESERLEETLCESVKCAEFAARLGAGFVLFKAADRPTFIKAAKPFLDAIDELDVVPLVQNHYRTALNSLDDVKEVIEGINDPRIKALLEVGHFHSAGVHWKDAAEYLGESVALIHIKDQIGAQSVPLNGTASRKISGEGVERNNSVV